MPSVDDYIKKSKNSVSILQPSVRDFKTIDEYQKFLVEFEEASAQLLNDVEKSILEQDAAEKAKVKELLKEKGFVNLHTTNNNDGKGDGKWYSLSSGKTQHKGDTSMTLGEAIDAAIERG